MNAYEYSRNRMDQVRNWMSAFSITGAFRCRMLRPPVAQCACSFIPKCSVSRECVIELRRKKRSCRDSRKSAESAITRSQEASARKSCPNEKREFWAMESQWVKATLDPATRPLLLVRLLCKKKHKSCVQLRKTLVLVPYNEQVL